MKVAKQRQSKIVEYTVAQINKKKQLQSQASRLSRCWNLIKRLAGILIFFGILFLILKPVVYRKMGWEIKPATPSDQHPRTFESPRHEDPRREQVFRSRMTPEEVEQAEKERLRESM